MNGTIPLAMVNNATLLLALSIVYEISFIFRHRLKKNLPVFSGVLIGLIGIAIMSYPFNLFEGLFFDTRSILICVTALIFGVVPASISAAVMLIYRLAVGGIGVLPGVLVIASSLALGLLFRRFMTLKRSKMRWLKIYVFGITVHVVMLICMLSMPWDVAVMTLSQVSFPVLLIYPVGVVLLALLLQHQVEYNEAMTRITETEERFRTLVDNAPDTIFVIVDGVFVFINKAGLKLLGADKPDDLLGKPGMSIIHPDFHEDVNRYMADLWAGKTSPSPEERAYIRLDSTVVYVDVIVVPIRYNDKNGDLVFARDITERKLHQQKEQELAAQLRQQQKLEAIGTLAGGVAHEINNPLNGIMNYAQLILDGSDGASNSAAYAREIIQETERISVIVKNLLQFSRQEKQSHSYASIYDIIGQTVSLISTIIKKDQIILDIHIDDGLPDIKCRSQQIQQVIMNLLTNARDALNAKYPGYDENKVIRLRCSKFHSEGRRWLRLTVQDNGEGIPNELRERIFEPFFSTKPKETGTGLGLSISYGIVSEHHGKLTFESELGKYTTFILELPVDNGWTL